MTPRLDRLIARLHDTKDEAEVVALLAEHETSIVESSARQPDDRL